MKYRPSKRVIWLMIPLLPLLLMFIGAWCAEKTGIEAKATRGLTAPKEKSFSTTSPSTWPTALARPRDWYDQGIDAIMKWDQNPWKTNDTYFGRRFHELRESQNPQDQAEYRELLRLGKEWHQRILARHPELAITYRDVPDDRNGLLHWMELMKRLKADHPDKPISLDFPEEFSQHFRKKQNWNPVAARSWLDANRTLLDEIRAIGLMPDQSAKGIDPASRPWSMSLDSAKALLMDAHLAAEQGDTARALESVRAANGLANHLKRSESPLMIDVIYGSSIQQKIQEYVFSAILPSLPAGQTDIAAWENAVNPTLQQPGDFSRIIKGEWNGTMPTELLPAMSDSTDPHNPSDPEALAEAFTLNMENIARQNDDITLAELPDNPTPQADLSKLSWRSRELANDLGMSGQYDSRRYWARYQVSTGMTQAAFAILKGQPVPNDPVSGQPYTWDPATRILSAPAGKDFERMRIQLTLPKF